MKFLVSILRQKFIQQKSENSLPLLSNSMFFLSKVKISNHLGDDVQYLILVSSAPSKSKMQTGPSRMHIQDRRFCLTTGVPPKLLGLWDIAYLRYASENHLISYLYQPTSLFGSVLTSLLLIKLSHLVFCYLQTLRSCG